MSPAVTPLDSKPLPLRFGLRVALPAAAAFLLIIALVGAAIAFAASSSDEVATSRQTRMVQQALAASLDQVTQTLEGVAVWDDTYDRLSPVGPDTRAWVDENIGAWLHEAYGHDEIYLFDARDSVVYGRVGGNQVAPDDYRFVRPDLGPFVAKLALLPAPVVSGPTGAAQSRLLPSGVRLPLHAVHVSHLTLVRGRLAAVSAMKVVPHSPARPVAAGGEGKIVSVRYLDGAFLAELERRNLLEGVKFERREPNGVGASFTLWDGDGRRIGWISWRPELPGAAVVERLRVPAILATVSLALLLALLAVGLWRSMRKTRATLETLQASERRAWTLAYQDALTALPNRTQFAERLDAMLAEAAKVPTALFLLDLDRFKNVNDRFGHAAGDRLICDLADRLTALVDTRGIVARLGGDEFAVAVHMGARDAQVLAERLVGAARAPFDLGAAEAWVGMSVGLAMAPEHGLARDDLMRRADIALYRAKNSGRNVWVGFDASMDEIVRERGQVERDLRQALADPAQFEAVYQPILSTASGRVIGMEALVRWQHPERGPLAPEAFLAVAEDTGLIAPIGEFVLEAAARVALANPGLLMSVNVSAVQFRSSTFADRTLAAWRGVGADPAMLELEVTETVLVENDDLIRATLARLRRSGVRIALDDFGTGYSSLSHLQRFKVDRIKIDRSFVAQIGGTVDTAPMVGAMIALGHAAGLEVTAEGVETEAQWQALAALGCDHVQGFAVASPVTGTEVGAAFTAPARKVA
jgi:diguanylate cyclase (GGDEF)-like protein